MVSVDDIGMLIFVAIPIVVGIWVLCLIVKDINKICKED